MCKTEVSLQDVEEESTDVKKPTKSTKRSRTAEVHNLSERVCVRTISYGVE